MFRDFRSQVALLLCTLFGTPLMACRETRSAAAEVSGEDVRRLPPGRNARVPDVMMQAADAGRSLGLGGAPVRMHVVSDYQCAECRVWFEETLPAVRATYIDGGRLSLVWVHYPLRAHPDAVRAASAALCASAQGKFWEASARVFAAQERWAGARDAAVLIDSLARVPGVDAFTLQNCTQSARMLRQVRADIDWADSLRIGAPITVRIGERRLAGLVPISALRATIDSALADASR